MFYHVSSLDLGSLHRYPSHQKAILYPAYKFMWNPQSIRLSGAVSLQLVPVSLEELSLPLSSAPLLLPPCQQIQQLLHKSSQMRLHDSRQTIRDNILPLIGVFPSLFSGELSAGSIFFFSKRQFLKALKYNVLWLLYLKNCNHSSFESSEYSTTEVRKDVL